MDIVGVDVATKICSSSHLDGDGGMKSCLEFANEREGWQTLEADLGPNTVVVMEAGTGAYSLRDHLRARGHRVVMADPRGVRAIAAGVSKTDRKDSLALAPLYRLGYLTEAYVPPRRSCGFGTSCGRRSAWGRSSRGRRTACTRS